MLCSALGLFPRSSSHYYGHVKKKPGLLHFENDSAREQSALLVACSQLITFKRQPSARDMLFCYMNKCPYATGILLQFQTD